MNAAELYANFNKLQKHMNNCILHEYVDLLNFESDEKLCEVGCGVGESTRDLLKVIPQNYHSYIATDISRNMILHGQKHNDNPRLRYQQLDITDANIPKEFLNSFDKVFSFKTMHWVDAEKQLGAFTNIQRMLKKGGCIFISLVGDCPSFLMYREMYKNPKWRKYMKHSQEFASPYNRSNENVDETLLKVLADSGFQVITYQNTERMYYFKSIEDFVNTVKAFNPFLERIPVELHEDYWKDSMEIYRNVCPIEENGEFWSDIIFIYAKKL